MNTKVALAAGGVIILAVIGFLMFGNKGENLGINNQNQESLSEKSSLKNLLTRSGSHMCTFDETTANSQNSGTVYISNGRMRGDFTSVISGKTVQSHMIAMQNESYVWTDETKQGFKMMLDQSAQGQAQQNQSVDINAELNYNCTSWSEDSNKFNLPSDIKFTSMQEMMGGMMNGSVQTTGGTNASQCSVCDQAPEPQRTQCRTALGCK